MAQTNKQKQSKLFFKKVLKDGKEVIITIKR